MFFNYNQQTIPTVQNLLTDSAGTTTTSETLYASAVALIVLAISYLYQTETETLRTAALIVVLLLVTIVCAVNYNTYLALTLLIAETAAITALTLLQQAYYSARILNTAPLLVLAAYPIYEQTNTYFSSVDPTHYTYSNSAEAASELYKSLLSPTDPYTPTLLSLLTWGSIFVAVLVASTSN